MQFLGRCVLPLGERRGGKNLTQEMNGTVKFYNGVERKRELLRESNSLFGATKWQNFMMMIARFWIERNASGVADPNTECNDLAIIIKWNGLSFTSQYTCVIIPRRANGGNLLP